MEKKYSPDTDLLKGRIILVTGASEGIGKSVAANLAAYGATVILMARNRDKLQTLAEKIISAGDPEPLVLPMDFESASFTTYESKAAFVREKYGRLDGLVHNAGTLGEMATIEKYDAELWKKVMQVNFHSEFLLTKAFLGLLRKSVNSSMIFTTSNLGIRGRANWGAYCVSKFATEGFAQILHQEEQLSGSSLRINTVNPGRIRTGMRAAAYPEEDPNTLSTPQEIMPVYLYLMGKDSINVKGTRIDAQNWQFEAS